MITFPYADSIYASENDRLILSRMETDYTNSIMMNQYYWVEGDIDTRFEVSDQTVWGELYGNLSTNRGRQFSFNHIRRIVNMISGHQRRNRKSTIVTPVENGDSETADQFTKVMMWVNNQDGILETISEAFHGSLITGINLLQVWVDYRNDPISGNIKVDNCSYNSFIIDPYFRKADLSDCNFVWKRSFLAKRDVISLLPDHTEEILGLYGNISGNGRDGKFAFLPEAQTMGTLNLLTYDEYYYRDYRMQKLLVDAETGETQEWKSQDEDRLAEFLQQFPSVTVIESEIPTVSLAIVVQGKVMYHGPNPIGTDKFPFIPVLSYFSPQCPIFYNRIQGVVRSLRDPQFLYNRQIINGFDAFESQINSGWKYKENALVNPADVFMHGQGKGLALKDDAQMTDVERIQPAEVSASGMQMAENMKSEMPAISGVNEELLGSATDDKAGVLSMLRQGAGLVTLQILFDQLDRSQKLLGEVIIDIIQANFTPGKIKKILEGEEPKAQFYSKSFGKYHCVIEEGLNTSTQKQMQFAQMLQLREVGVPISTQDLLEAATIQGKKKIIENAMKQEQQVQQQQQQQVQMQMQLQQAQIEDMHGRRKANEGLFEERHSRVMENYSLAVEREHKANSEDSTAALNRVKALKELESMDLTHLEQLTGLLATLKAQESSASEKGVVNVAETQQSSNANESENPESQSL